MSLPAMFLLAVLLRLIAGCRAQALNVTGIGNAPVFPAVFGFGDSLVDTGNNNLLPTIAKCNFPPYGKDFPGHQATGRFSNGKVPMDFIASGLGIKDLLPPYLGPELTTEDFITGVCFASGSSGIDPLTNQITSTLSLSDQLDLFRSYQDRLRDIVGDGASKTIINSSLYVICTGNNDIVNTYFGSPFRRSHYDFPTYAKFLVHSVSAFIKELYNLGARKIAMVGVPPLGCIPSQRTFAGGFQRKCVTLYNEASQKYNRELSAELQRLDNKLSNATIRYVDLYNKVLHLIQNFSEYGFDEPTKGCCGTGEVEVSVLCNAISSNTCPNDSKYIFWDSFHPTERTYKIIVDEIFQNEMKFFI